MFGFLPIGATNTKNMNFLVIDRKGTGNNLVIHNFKNEKISLKY